MSIFVFIVVVLLTLFSAFICCTELYRLIKQIKWQKQNKVGIFREKK